MKVKETSNDGFKEYVIKFKETKKPSGSRTFYATNGDPISVRVIKSGWDYGYPTYHVITEWGDYEDSQYQFLSESQLEEKLGISLSEEPDSLQTPALVEQMDLISDLLSKSKEHGLETEVITWALKFMQENPEIQPYEAFAMGFGEWVK
jgi:hypothetical protein